jgi:hypothetical protein
VVADFEIRERRQRLVRPRGKRLAARRNLRQICRVAPPLPIECFPLPEAICGSANLFLNCLLPFTREPLSILRPACYAAVDANRTYCGPSNPQARPLEPGLEVLQEPTKLRGRPPKNPLTVVTAVPPKANGTSATKKRTFTTEQRKAQAKRMKAYSAAKKRGK